MEEVIKKIIQIELDAKKMINDVLEEKRNKEINHNLAINELREATIKKAMNKVEQIRLREFKEIEDSEIKKRQRCEIRLQQMEEYAKEKMDVWVDELVNRVLS